MSLLSSTMENCDLPSSLPTHNHESSHPASPPQRVGVTSPPPQLQTQTMLLFVGFNQDYGCFACGTDTGFRVYNCDPFKEILRRDFEEGGIGVVEMLFRCNILALVGGGIRPKYPPNKVMIWDDHQTKCIGELTLWSEVRAVKLRRDCIVVVLEYSIHIYNLANLKSLFHVETIPNMKGLCALSPVPNSSALACPGIQIGQVQINHLQSKKPKFVMAHESQLACIALSQDGQLLATASKKGTLIRVFNTVNGTQVQELLATASKNGTFIQEYNTVDGTQAQELRRGADRAEIYSLAFSACSKWLAVSSDKGTIHVFRLRSSAGMEEQKGLDATGQSSNNDGSGRGVASSRRSRSIPFTSTNPGSSLAFFKGVLPKYFSSEWSFAQFRLPEEIRCIVGFGPQKNTVVVLGLDGSFYRCEFDPVKGGEMMQQEYSKFFKPKDEELNMMMYY